MAEKTTTVNSASTSHPTRTPAAEPVAKRLRPAAGAPRQAVRNLASGSLQLRQLQSATGNFAMGQLVAGAPGVTGDLPSPPTAELASTSPDMAVRVMDTDRLDFAPADTLPMAPPALFAPPTPPYGPLSARATPTPTPPGTLAPADSAPAATDGRVVERPPTSPTARQQALQTAQEHAERTARSDEPEFAQSVAVMPTADIQQELPASPPGETAQTDEQQATLQASEEATEQLDEAAQGLAEAEPPVEEAAPAEGIAPGGGAPSVPKAADLAAAAGQALNVLATPLVDVSTLTARRVQFAPRPEERSPQTPQAGFQAARKRAASEALASEFLTHNAAQAQNLLVLGLTAPPRIFTAAVQAKSAIDAAVAQNIGAVQAQIAAIRSQVVTEAEAAIAGIIAQRDQARTALTTATLLAKTTIDVTYTATGVLLNTQESNQLTKLENLYSTWEPKLRAVGTEVGNEAVTTAQRRADQWLSQRNGESSILDGPIHDNRLEARADAAKQVAKAYKESLEKAANEQTDKVLEGKPVVLDAVRQAAEQARTNLATHHQTMLDALAQSEAGALAQMEEAAASLTQAVEAGRESYLASLAEQAAAQTSRLFEYGERQKGAIDADASLAVLALASGVGDAVTAFNTGLEDFVATAQATAAPDMDALQPGLAEMQPQADMLLVTLLRQLSDGIQASEVGVIDGGVQGAQGVNALGQNAIEQASSTGSSHTQSVTALLEQATAGFTRLQAGHTNTVTEAMTSAVTGFTATSSELTKAFTQLSENALKNFVDGQTQLRAGLRTQGLKDLNDKIETEAQKAADAVQPRWKKVVKWVITVVVVVAVVAISIATAGAGGVLGGILIGAALGGVAGATIQVGHNLVDGKEWSDGVGKAFVVGAIGGAFGGAGAALGKAVFGEVAKGVLNTGLKFGLEAGLDVIGGIVGDLAVGNPITLEGVLFGAAIGAGVSGGLAIGSALKGKIKIRPKVEIAAPRVGAPEVTAPTPKTAAPEVVAPPAPRAAMPEVAAPAPKAAAPEAVPTPKAPAPEVTPPAPTHAAPEAAAPPKAAVPEAAPAPTRQPHPEHPEIEEGIVAKQPTGDGHEVKVTKDGRVIRCTDCGELRLRYEAELKDPKLKKRLDDIEAIDDPKLKAEKAAEFDDELSGVRARAEAEAVAKAKKAEAEALIGPDNKFRETGLEDAYQAYVKRKSKKGQTPRGRADWKVARDFWLTDSPMARGNKFNATAGQNYPYNEVVLANGKRVDSYVPPSGGKPGEIISRKATDFDDIEVDTFKSYLSELKQKYAPGTEINSPKYRGRIPEGAKLEGKQILEVPDSNLAAANRSEFEKIAAGMGIDIRYSPE
jgi:hypothetical protein